MSKDLEKEYKELMKQETPDLWERIEGGLGAQETGKRPVQRKLYGFLGMVAAACICFAVASFVFDRQRPEGSYDADARDKNAAGGGEKQDNVSDSVQSHFSENTGGAAPGDMYADAGDADVNSEGAQHYDGELKETDSVPAETDMGSPESDRPREYNVNAMVTDIIEQENGTVYLVRVEETFTEDIDREDTLLFIDPNVLDGELSVGETYEFDVFKDEEINEGAGIWTIRACREKSVK